MEILVSSLSELEKVVQAILDLIQDDYKVFLLSGELGSGKTTLVQFVCKRLGVNDPVSSPTFSLINAYDSPVYGVVYHMDLYRLEKPTDLVQIGIEEYLESGSLCFIEWPAVAGEYYYPPYAQVVIEVENNNIRIFKITTYDTVDA